MGHGFTAQRFQKLHIHGDAARARGQVFRPDAERDLMAIGQCRRAGLKQLQPEIEPHRGSAAGIIRFHYPLIVPKEPEKCWIEIGGHHFFWKEGEPLVFDDTREHWVKNQTDQTRVVLIIDFNANMPFPVNLYTGLRYNLVRRSAEVKKVIERASIGVPPRNQAAAQTGGGLISGARSTTAVPAGARSDERH